MLLAISLWCTVQARYVDGQSGCVNGGYLYTAQVSYTLVGGVMTPSGNLTVTKISTSGSTPAWVTNIPAPSGWTYVAGTFTPDTSIVRVDPSGQYVWALTMLYAPSNGTNEVQINQINNSTGALVFASGYMTQHCALSGLWAAAVDVGSSSELIMTSNFHPNGASGPLQAIVVAYLANNSNNGFHLFTTTPMPVPTNYVSATGEYIVADDMLVNNGNVYISGQTNGYYQATNDMYDVVLLNNGPLEATVSVVQPAYATDIITNNQYATPVPYVTAGATVCGRPGTGFLTTSNGAIVDYVWNTANVGASYLVTDGTNLYEAGTVPFQPTSILGDSGDNNVVMLVPPVTGYSTSYQVYKQSGGNLGSTIWSSTLSNAQSTLIPSMLAQDAGGNYLIVDHGTENAGGNFDSVEQLNFSTGVQYSSYIYSTDTEDHLFAVFPTTSSEAWNMCGTMDVSGTFYPLTLGVINFNLSWYYAST